jgi:hypothetical protein
LARYLDLVQAGRLYDDVAAQLGTTRQQIKERLFANWLFCRDHTHWRLGRAMEGLFPTATAAILALKAKDYAHAAHHLQRTESALMIRQVARLFAARHPDAFLATIHDSLLVHPELVAGARGLVTEVFARVGLTPTVRLEVLAREQTQVA